MATENSSLFSKYAHLLGQKLGSTTAYAAQLIRSAPHVLDELKDHLIAELEDLRQSLPGAVKAAEVDAAAVGAEVQAVEQTVNQVASEVKSDLPAAEAELVQAEAMAQPILQAIEQAEASTR